MTNETKQKAIDALRHKLPRFDSALYDIDPRLSEYFDSLVYDSSAEEFDATDRHNIFEVLGGLKFLRLFDTYEFDTKKVQQVIRLREGEWQQRDGVWHYQFGGLAQPGTQGQTVYRWQPFQIFILASVFGFMADIPDGMGGTDRRRLCTDFTFMSPRKVDKTGMSAFIQVVFFLLEDANAECYCCANSADQSKLLYRRAKLMLQQLDDGHRLRLTETVCDWRPAFKMVRDSSIRPLSAGGKAKDGMFAQLCCADEYGSAAWINGKSDMKMLVDVVQSSMGPRREPLTFTTTTAGRISQGPFIEKLDGIHRMLLAEIDPEHAPELATDRMLCLCLEPDEWERDEEYLLTSREVRLKVNPMLGIITQHQFYDDEIAKARLTGDTAEVITKLLNVYQAATVQEWVAPERIRQLQAERRIDDCRVEDGWEVYAGLDFSQGNDLHAVTYLAARWTDVGREFFVDMDAWVNEETLSKSSIRDLLNIWIRDGWLHVSEGQVFQPTLPVQRIRELDAAGISFIGFGYDAHLSKEPINELKAWLQSIGLPPDDMVVAVSQTLGAFNPAVDRLTYLIKGNDIPFHFSASPLWPWQFGNTVLDVDQRMGNRKPVKRNPGSDGCKVDNVQCLCECFLLEELFEGKSA